LSIYKHNQKWVKVNVNVDRKIAGLISALNTFPKLRTCESCEGDEHAFVTFTYGDYWNRNTKEMSGFVMDYLGPKLIKKFGDNINIRLRINTTFINIEGELFCCKSILSKLADYVFQLARAYKD